MALSCGIRGLLKEHIAPVAYPRSCMLEQHREIDSQILLDNMEGREWWAKSGFGLQSSAVDKRLATDRRLLSDHLLPQRF